MLNFIKNNRLNNIADNKNVFFLIHFFIYMIGLVALIILFSHVIFTSSSPYPLINNWDIPFYFPDKMREIVVYILSIAAIFLYFLTVSVLYRNNIRPYFFDEFEYKGFITLIFLLVAFLFNVALLCAEKHYGIVLMLGGIIWCFSICLPFWNDLILALSGGEGILFVEDEAVNVKCVRTTKKIFYIILFVVFVQFVWIFYPLVFGPLRIMNEYWDIPEQTVLNGHVVDNTKFINEYHLIGLHDKYDIRDPNQTNKANCLDLPDTSTVRDFIEQHNSQVNAMVGTVGFAFKPHPVSLYYYHHGFCLAGFISNQDLAEINFLLNELIPLKNYRNFSSNKISIDFIYSAQIRTLKKLILKSNNFKQYSLPYFGIEKLFLKQNLYEIHWQVLNRFFIHHQNFVLGPVNAMNLGQNPHQIFMQYGYLNTKLLTKFLHVIGGVNYQRYIKTTFSVYYIYYSLFLAFLFLIFKDIRYVLPAFLLTVAALNFSTFEFLYIAPGINPLRHFFDLPIMLFFFFYLKKKHEIFLWIALLFSYIEILTNDLFGCFILFSLLLVLFIRTIFEKQSVIKNLIFSAVVLMIGMIIFHLASVGTNVMTKYYLEGVLGFSYKTWFMVACLLLIGVSYIISFCGILKKDNFSYFVLLLIFYSQGLFFYFVWGSDLNHLYVFSPIFAITFVAILKALDNQIPLNTIFRNFLLIILTGLSFLVWIPSVALDFHSRSVFNEVFKTHKIYQWNLPTAKFISTMNPDYFKDSIQLIQRYSSGNKIYIISKYDNFIPFLAEKYSAMPYFDLQWFLISPKEVAKSIDAVEKNKPKYIFVDSDINRSYAPDMINAYAGQLGYLSDESVMRVMRLNELKKVFDAVKNDYHPVQSALLLTVYERNTTEDGH